LRRDTPSRAIACAYAAAGLTAFLLSLGPEVVLGGATLGRGLYGHVQDWPLIGMLRSPQRLVVVVRLGMAVLVALAAHQLLGRLRARLRTPVAALIGVLLLVEQWSPLLTEGRDVPLGARLPEVYSWLATRPERGPLAEMPAYPFNYIRLNELEAALSTTHGRPILFAKPSFAPPAAEYLRHRLRGFPDDASLTLLRALGVETVIVHPHRWRELEGQRAAAEKLRRVERYGAVLRLEHSSPESDDPVHQRFHLGGERVYRLAPLDATGEPRACACREIDRTLLRAEAFPPTIDPAAAFDGRRETPWSTVRPQQAGDGIVLGLDRTRPVARLEIEAAFPYERFAQDLEVSGRRADGIWGPLQVREDVWYDVALVRQLVRDPARARLRLDLGGDGIDRLMLRIKSAPPAGMPWSIPEVHLFESVDSVRAGSAKEGSRP
jgi:hypothetical protein